VRVFGCRAAGLLVVAVLAAATVLAQDVVVDGERITADDIDQRTRFDQLAAHKLPSREQVIDELRDEALWVREARRYGLDISDRDIDNAYANMAGRMHLTAEQLTQALSHQGVDARTLKRKIRAEIARQQLRRSKPNQDQPMPPPSTGPRLRDPGPSLDGPDWCVHCPRQSDVGGPLARRMADGRVQRPA